MDLKESDLVTFSHAAAGHEGVLSDASGQLVIKPCVQQEVDFYQSSLNDHPDFAAFMPTFMGTLKLSAGDPEKVIEEEFNPNRLHGKKLATGESIVLENITAGFVKPNVLDVKLGAQLWDEGASQDKRDRLDKVAATTTSSSLGFRVAGMKVYGKRDRPVDEEGYTVYDKFYGRSLTKDNVVEAFQAFLGESKLAGKFLADVEALQKVLENQESRMYSASILFVYEGDSESLKTAKNAHKTKLIDFAHASWTPGQGPDENALQGVRSVVQILKTIS